MLKLLNFIFQGDQKKLIQQLREMINEGIEPTNFLNDLLEVIYFILQKKNIGDFDSDLSISESEVDMINVISRDINISTLIIFWERVVLRITKLQLFQWL